MNNLEKNKTLIVEFIHTIWNEMDFTRLENFIHEKYIDHSLPPNLAPNVEGLEMWIAGTSRSFVHRSVIEEQVTEDNKSVVKLRMFLKHIGYWRGIEPNGAEISVVGYRFFKIEQDKIIEHWGLLDGNSIENQLKESSHGCKIQE